MDSPYSGTPQHKDVSDTTFCGFEVGQHVACVAVDATNPDLAFIDPIVLPEVGKIYTIRSLHVGDGIYKIWVKLLEIPDQRIRFLLKGELITGEIFFFCMLLPPVAAAQG